MRKRKIDSDVLAFALRKLRSHLRITADDLDEELVDKLLAAVDSAEHRIGRVIFQSSFRDTIPFSSVVCLDRPLISVDGLEVNGETISAELYKVNLFEGTVTFSEGVTGESVKVEYTAGMEQVPADIMNAILLIASSLFSNPMDSVETLPKASTKLLRPYRNYDR